MKQIKDKNLIINKRGLYIHVPFCDSLCSYCDFAKMHNHESLIKPYLNALKKEIESYNIKDIKTIYIGGGTPSCLSLEYLKQLLDIVDPYFNEDIQEYTFECNVESVTLDKLILLKQYGVNRLSFGVQSTDDKILKLMNRKHDFKMVKDIIFLARSLGFNNISVDLILGIKERSLKQLEKEIKDILSLDIQHISTYCLTIHENTKFYIDKYISKDDDEMAEEMFLVNQLLSENGFTNYEVSNYCLGLRNRSKHNLIYWNNEEYYGVGLHASGYLDNVRYTNNRNILKYNNFEFVDFKEEIKDEDDFLYYIMLKLRLSDGIDLKEFEDKFGFKIEQELIKTIYKWKQTNHLLIDDTRLSLSFKGRMILHTIVIDFLKGLEILP